MNENIENIMETDTGFISVPSGNISNISDINPIDGTGNVGIDGDTANSEATFPDMDDTFGDIHGSVSSGDILSLQAETEIPGTYDYSETLQSIDSKLSLIIFLILSFWVIKYIRISVRNFTGRGIDK